MLLVEQNTVMALRHCSRAAVMVSGKLVLEGTAATSSPTGRRSWRRTSARSRRSMATRLDRREDECHEAIVEVPG